MKQSEKPFIALAPNISNLDDRYENGVHDLMKFVKLDMEGSDHLPRYKMRTKDRSQSVQYVISSDLDHWLPRQTVKWVVWQIADTFRDPRVLCDENGNGIILIFELALHTVKYLTTDQLEKYRNFG